MSIVYNIFKKQIITEKTNNLKKFNEQLVIEVSKYSSKLAIKSAIKELFKIKKFSIRTINYRGKQKKVKKNIRKQKNWKKAIIILKNKKDIVSLNIINPMTANSNNINN